MARLDEYRRKRDFSATPEPRGRETPSPAGRFYAVQKHESQRLHWDLRLELDGVLRSWAVPKGPSLDPADKRLAMAVEDHPIEYREMEGVIPKGQYGGGTVMLWDRGTWQPEGGDPREQLASGELKFRLFGERLRGRWMLVRTKGYGARDRESWLLFKERDDEAKSASLFDAAAQWTTSVATGRTMAEIAAAGDVVPRGERLEQAGAVPRLPRATGPSGAAAAASLAAGVRGAREAPMPRRIDVALATLAREVPEGDDWLHEIKYDGYRVVCFLEEGAVRLMSRGGQDWTARFASVAAAVGGLPARRAVLDGELVAERPDGRGDFQALQSYSPDGAVTLRYMAFDLLYVDGLDLRDSPLADRKRALERLLSGADSVIRYTDHIEGHGDLVLKSACGLALEGVVSKRHDSAYRPGRGSAWLKTKCVLRQEFVVVGWTEPTGQGEAFGALVVGIHDEGAIRQVGRVGTGFSTRSRSDIGRRLAALARNDSPVANPSTAASAQAVHWVEPVLVVEVAFAGWTKVGRLRQPIFLGVREDKPAAEVRVEVALTSTPLEDAGASAQAGTEAATEAGTDVVAGVRLTHPGRLLWSDAGVSKLDLARHYESVAELMLPHVVNRPLSLVRCPGGTGGQCFYQKHVADFPAVVDRIAIDEPTDDEPEPYPAVRSLSGLVGLVQMGVLEIHPWGARSDEPEKPDRIVFDLDPDPSLPWTVVTGTARLLRAELRAVGLESWVKTTGGKGLHVVAPIARRHGWGEVHDLTRAFADAIVAREPRLFTTSLRKADRGGKILVDYLRNARGATAVAPYSTRARPGAPVAVPLYWEELEDMTERPEFTLVGLRARLATLGGDPWRDLPRVRQSISQAVKRRIGER